MLQALPLLGNQRTLQPAQATPAPHAKIAIKECDKYQPVELRPLQDSWRLYKFVSDIGKQQYNDHHQQPHTLLANALHHCQARFIVTKYIILFSFITRPAKDIEAIGGCNILPAIVGIELLVLRVFFVPSKTLKVDFVRIVRRRARLKYVKARDNKAFQGIPLPMLLSKKCLLLPILWQHIVATHDP